LFLKVSRNILWLVPMSLAILVNFSAPRTCTAQVLYGTLLGNVTDASDAVVPGATVKILHKETNQTRQTTTSGNGGYSFTNISSGTYEVEVTKEGFSSPSDQTLRSASTRWYGWMRNCKWDQWLSP
jgi:hypothetical protein